MAEHKCIDCGALITGKADKRRCDSCRRTHELARGKEWQKNHREQVRKYQNERNAAKRAAAPLPRCKKCGEEFERTASAQKYCPKCQSKKIMKSFRPRKRNTSLAQDNQTAREHGLSYGQAKARGII